MPMKAMKAAKAVAPPKRRGSTNAMKAPKVMKAMKSRSTKAMPVPKTAAKPKAAAKAKNAKTKAVTMLAKRRQVHECDESDESAQGDESDEGRPTQATPVHEGDASAQDSRETKGGREGDE